MKNLEMNQMFRKRLENIQKEGRTLVAANHGLVIFVSGGIDSVVLWDVMQRTFGAQEAEKRPNIRIFHVNYGLRGADSDRDEEFVRALGASYGVEVIVATPPDAGLFRDEYAKGTQLWAREFRLGWARNFIRQGNVAVLAHHQDDLAETILLRMSRGVSSERALGMRPFARGIWRPLLDWSRAEIAQYAANHALEHREDGSNAKLKYGRNRIRHLVVPVLEGLHEGATKRIVQLTRERAEMAHYLKSMLKAEVKEYMPIDVIPISALLEKPKAMQHTMLGLVFDAQFPHSELRLKRGVVSDILERLHKPDGKLFWNYDISREISFVCRGNCFRFEHRSAATGPQPRST